MKTKKPYSGGATEGKDFARMKTSTLQKIEEKFYSLHEKGEPIVLVAFAELEMELERRSGI